MISVDEAKAILDSHVFPLTARELPLTVAAGRIVAEAVYAPTDIPAFPQSSMDGYAFSFSDWQPGQRLTITGEMAAGASQEINCLPGSAVRVFTGAPVPAGADTVIMQEKTSVEDGLLQINDEKIQAGSNFRARGSEIKKGDLAVAANTYLSPAAIGFLAGAGIAAIRVFPVPSIALIITGNELQLPGNPLHYGQVYESNSYTLAAALEFYRIRFSEVLNVPDDPQAVQAALEKTIAVNDIVLLTGGVSAGKYDFVLQAAAAAGITTLFHKVKQRPGKPLYAGKKRETLIFGLPGNPSSVLTCFYQYVAPAIEKMSHRENRMPFIRVPLVEAYEKPAGLTHFLKGSFDGERVSILHAQESYRMHSFAEANCLVQVGEDTTICRKGELVDIFLFQV